MQWKCEIFDMSRGKCLFNHGKYKACFSMCLCYCKKKKNVVEISFLYK